MRILDRLAIGSGHRLSKIIGIDDEVVIDIFSREELIDCFRLTGEVLTAASPLCVNEEPGRVFCAEIMQVVVVAVTVFEADISEIVAYIVPKRSLRRTGGWSHTLPT
jgi:tRNA(Phe) wybutosine-synthesizing methylase Tyw3